MDSVKLIFAGDFAPINDVSLDSLNIESELKQKLVSSDYFFLNLEAPITKSKVQRIKAGSNLKIQPQNCSLLENLNVKSVSLANNHIFDYEEQGAFDTIKFLKKLNIDFWGIGENKISAWKPYIVEKNNIRVAIVSYAEHEFNWNSDDDWCTSMLEPAANAIQVAELSKTVDHVVVFTHTGPENWHYPSPRQVKLFRSFIDAGASAVINSHSHTIMGMEQYKNRPIYYSLGNFFFPYLSTKESWHKGILVELTLNKLNKKLISNEIPVQFSNEKIFLESDLKSFDTAFKTFSENLNDDRFIQNKWDEFGKQEEKKLLKEITKGIIAVLIGVVLGPFSNRFKEIKMKGIAILRGYTICENHIENIGNILNIRLNFVKKKYNT